MNLLERLAAALLLVIGLGLFEIYVINGDSIVGNQLEETNDIIIRSRWNSRPKRIAPENDDDQKLHESNDATSSDSTADNSIPAMLEPEKSKIAPIANLNITVPEIFVSRGESVYVACHGNYKNVSWSREQQLIARESDKTTSVFYHAYTIMGINASILIIKEVIKQSAGYYECSVVDDSSQKKGTAGFRLIITEPQVHIKLSDTSASKYSTEYYSNICEGNSNTINWMNPEGRIIGTQRVNDSYPYVKYGENKAEIIFESLDIATQGTYKCFVTLFETKNSTDFTLIVKAHPNLFFSSNEDSAQVEVNSFYSVDCSGDLDKFFWKDFNNNNVTSEKSERIYAEYLPNRVKLVIKKAFYKLAGNYTCVGIIEDENKTVERIFSLEVIKKKSLSEPVLIPSNSTILKEAGMNMTITCQGESSRLIWKGPPNNWIIPEKESNIYSTGVEAVGDDEYINKLIMENLEVKNSGAYTCEITDDHGRTLKKHFMLTVFIRIHFIQNKTTYETVENKTYILECGIEGSPAPSVVWYFNGQPIDDKLHYERINENIMILNPKYNDTGKYVCSAHQMITATDGFDDSRAMSLRVKHKPVFPDGAKITLYNYINRTIELKCNDVSYPEAKYNWIKNDKLIGIKKTVNYISVNFESASDFGDYECKAENEYGFAMQTITVEESEKPDVPTLEVKKICSDKIELSISSEKNSITHYVVVYNVADEEGVSSKQFAKGDTCYALDSLKSNTTYVLRAASVNNVEQSDFSQDKKVTTENCAFHQQLSLLMKVTLTVIVSFQLFY